MDINSLRLNVQQEREASRAAARNLALAAQTNDASLLIRALNTLQHDIWNGWRHAVRLLRSADIHRDFPVTFLKIFERDGEAMRDSVNDDLLLCDLLRLTLPRYAGPSVQLYRGDSMLNRRRRTYGPSWTTTRGTAEAFALGMRRTCDGGSVVLETIAPPDAVICSPALLGNTYGEDEYVIDRRRLKGVAVVGRFTQISPDEHASQCAGGDRDVVR